MDLQRLFLFFIFTFSLFMVWDGWQKHQHPETGIQQSEIPDKNKTKTEVPSVSKLVQSGPISNQQDNASSARMIKVRTDVIEAEISTKGGDIDRLALLKHPDALDKNRPLVLFEQGPGTHNYIAQSGLIGDGLPNHNTIFDSEQEQYELIGDSDQIQVKLKALPQSDLKVTKIITFHKGSYVINVSYELENTGKKVISTSPYFQLVRDSNPPSGSLRFLPTYTGAAVYSDKEKFQKVEFKDIDNNKTKYAKQTEDGWIGMLQHYFVAAWLPEDKIHREYFIRKLDENLYSIGFVYPTLTLEPGKHVSADTRLYVGPTESNLDKVAQGLGLTVDYGWLTIIATPLFWIMSLIHGWTHNWGVAIVLLTVLIKLLFFPLSAASYRSMAKMRVVAPKLEKIKQQYADDREQLNRAMMELYKTEKINPLGGCLPVLIQIPVFIALYWAILSSVELRFAPFYGWITDLSSADPYYVLPIIMGASMIIQMRLNPKPPDPIQAKVMQVMPIMFSVMFFFFPAGLVLYSIVNNILSILQQWYITKTAGGEGRGGNTSKR